MIMLVIEFKKGVINLFQRTRDAITAIEWRNGECEVMFVLKKRWDFPAEGFDCFLCSDETGAMVIVESAGPVEYYVL